ncbi:MAG: hypothetical protein GXY83_13015 [Rhodopirellula sp.]|nr:hypothetical protein [Rhodopirellula sp.]
MFTRLLLHALPLLLGVLISPCPAVSLDGPWQLCRTQSSESPAADAKWSEIEVPALVDQLDGHPFLWYRRTFRLPESAAGRHLFLQFGAVRFVCEVYLNGEHVGGHYGGWEPFEVEISGACRGGDNELVVRVQDVTGMVEQEMDYAKQGRGVRFVAQAKDAIMAPVGSQSHRIGIWEPVSLVARGDVYVDDVFVRTSVRRKRIEAIVRVKNLGETARTVGVRCRVEGAGMTLPPASVSVAAGETVAHTLAADWPNPRLWNPEDPHLDYLETTVEQSGKPLDTRRTRFGFREFWTDGPNLVLNGTPMKFLATAGHPRGELNGEMSKAAAVDFYRRIREAGCVAMRLHANVWPSHWYDAADEVGMPIILESALFCWAENYALSKPKFWENYHEHLRGIVEAHRNHPAIVMTSLENEILHCGGERVPETAHRLAEAGRLVKSLDPTRPILYDGDGDPEGVADVVNLHYPLDFDKQNLWPDAGYWLEQGMVVRSWPREFFQWDRKKPLYFGEFLHIQHYTEVDPYTVLLGDSAYLGHRQAMERAKALAWEMQIEAYRACDLSGLCPWTLTETGPFPSDDNPRYLAVKRAYEKNGAYVRQYDRRFFSGEKVPRTVYLYNDTPHAAELEFQWQLKQDANVVDSGTQAFSMKSAERRCFEIAVRMPSVEQRTPLALCLEVRSAGRTVFTRSQEYWVFPRRPLAAPKGLRIALLEGDSRVISEALTAAKTPFTRTSNLTAIPAADVLVIGPHALDEIEPAAAPPVAGDESGAREVIDGFVRGGGNVIVLEQDNYNSGLFPVQISDRGASIAFPRAFDERLLTGIEEGDLRFWRGDHVVARKTILKPRQGRFRPLIDSGGPRGLVNLPLMEIRSGRGRYVFSQLAIGEKLATEPVARQIFENLLRYVADERPAPVRMGLVEDTLPLSDRIAATGCLYENLSGGLAKADLSAFGVVLAEADCEEVRQNLDKLRRFVESGGRLVLHGGTPAGLARLQSLFPEPITAQRSSVAPVSIAGRDAVIEGLTNQELYWYGDRKGLSYRIETPLSTEVCRHAIVAGAPDPAQSVTIEAESMQTAEGTPRYGEKEVYLWSTGGLKKQVDFPADGEYAILVRGRGTPVADVYPQIAVSIDGRPCGSLFTENRDWGVYAVSASVKKGAHELKLAFVNDAHDPERGEDRNVTLDNVTIGRLPAMQSKRLLTPAALVKVPLGKGMILLDQVGWASEEADADKVGRYLCNVLVNLGCDFDRFSGTVTVPGNQLEAAAGTKLHASRDGMAYLGTKGTVTATIRFAASRRYEITVVAAGTLAAGEYPKILMTLDGRPLGELTLRQTSPHTLRLKADVPEGEHVVGMTFTNDFYDPPEDRNLRIVELSIR